MTTSSYQRPTPTDLLSRIQADLEGTVTGITARLRRRFEYGLARAHMGVAHGLHGHLAWIARQIFPDLGNDDAVLRYATIFLEVPRAPAGAATGSGQVTGTGGDLTAGTQLVRPSDSSLYTVDATLSSVTTAQTVAFTAVTPGAAASIQSGDVLQLASPVANIDSDIGTPTAVAAGTDIETIPSVLDRLLDELQTPSRGGAPGDHVAWARQVSGVTRAWEYTFSTHPLNVPLGETHVFFVVDGHPTSLIPDSGTVAAVQAYVQAKSGSLVTVYAPTEVPYDYAASVTPTSAHTAVQAEVADMILRDAVPGGTILVSRLNEAISTASGETDHTISSPTGDVLHAYGELATAGTPTLS